jgi:hypothetical protein
MTRDTYSMVFAGPADIFLPQGTYVMQHDQLGSPLQIFIVPTGKAEDGFRYEAVFN